MRFEIWSVPNGRTRLVEPAAASRNVVPRLRTQVPDDLDPADRAASERIEWPVDGKDVVVTRTVRDANGRVVHRDTFVSHYHRMIGINRIGIG